MITIGILSSAPRYLDRGCDTVIICSHQFSFQNWSILANHDFLKLLIHIGLLKVSSMFKFTALLGFQVVDLYNYPLE